MMKRLGTRVVFGCLGLMALSAAVASSAHAELMRTGYGSIVASSTGKCIGVTGASMTPGSGAIQWRCNNAPDQQWTVRPLAGGYQIVDQNSGQCLWPSAGSTTSGTPLVQNTCSGASAELWTFNPSGNGFQLVSKQSGLCANITGGSTGDGDGISQAACSTASNFVFTFPSGLSVPTTQLVFQAGHSGQCLNVNGNSTAVGAKVIQWPCSGGANEQWTLVPSGDAYQVISKNSNLCMAVTGASTSTGAAIIQTTCSTATDRLWKLTPSGRAYALVAKNSGLCLDVTNSSQTNAAQVQQWTCNNQLQQQWSVSTATIPSSWSNLATLPVNPLGSANLPNGKVLLWSSNGQFSYEGDVGNNNTQTQTGIFDPATNTTTVTVVSNTGHDMFCPGTANLFDGRILVNGGSSSPKTSIYNPATNTWASDARMNIPRGYEGSTVLSTGSVLTLGGSWSGGQGNKNGELWTSGIGWQNRTGITAAPITGPDPGGVYRGDNHLWLFALPNGNVFHAGPSAAMHWITTTGSGTITSAGNRGDDPYAINGNAVLYDVNQIMKAGGGPAYENQNATRSTYTIALNTTTNAATVTKIAPMAYPRAYANGVILPNGQVVIVGGQTVPVTFTDTNAILVPEIWDPDTKVFRQLKPMVKPRNYHSSAILLADGRVFSGGGGQCGSGCAANHLDAQLLTPPYLLNADGTAATRPSITAAPSTGTLGGTIAVTTGGPVMSFVLMRSSSTTHTVNNDQRRVPLSIASTSSATSYVLNIPSDAGVALPGYYMLFALDGRGVPSVSASIKIQ
jgi:galactose oxidase